MHKNIMVSFDGSKESIRALEEAKQVLMTSESMVLHIVQIVNDSDLDAPVDMSWYGVNEYQTLDPEVITRIRQKVLDEKSSKMHDTLDTLVSDISNEVRMRAVAQTVSIAESILDYVHDNDIDLIIMGCRGLGAIRGVIGSVSYAVLRSSDVPILIVK